MPKPKVDPVAWAKAQKRPTGGTGCFTCGNPRIRAVLDKWIPLWRSGDIQISVRQARDFLAKHHGYKPPTSTFRNCLTDHYGYSPRG